MTTATANGQASTTATSKRPRKRAKADAAPATVGELASQALEQAGMTPASDDDAPNPNWRDIPIEELILNVSSENALEAAGITTLGPLVDLVKQIKSGVATWPQGIISGSESTIEHNLLDHLKKHNAAAYLAVATGEPEAAQVAKPKRERQKQKEFPGMERPKIQALEDAAYELRDVRAERQALTAKEVELAEKVSALMKKHQLKSYRLDDEQEVAIIPSDFKVKVRKIKQPKDPSSVKVKE